MSRFGGRVVPVVALTVAVLVTVVGPAGAAPAGAAPAAGDARAAGCAATPDARPSASTHASMPGMEHGSAVHPMQELTDQLARTPSGGTMKVPPGTYRGALVIDKPVTLVGIGHPVLRGDGTGTVLTIRAAGTTVRDLMLEGSGPGPVGNPAGVSVEADDVVVRGLHLRDVYTGIWVEGVRDAHITGNYIEGRASAAVSGVSPADDEMSGGDLAEGDTAEGDTAEGDMAGMDMGAGHASAHGGRGDGISLYDAVRPVVTGNTITDVRDGVFLSHGTDTRVECNTIVGSRYALHSMYGKTVTVARNKFRGNQSGPVLMYGGPVTLAENVIREHGSAATGFGVLLLDVSGARLLGNVIVGNRVGLQIDGPMGDPDPTEVELNTVALNQIGVGLYPTASADLSANSFVQNTVQVLGLGADGGGGPSRWSRDGVGNYWSDYRGFDRKGNGIGAIPHVEGAAAGKVLAGDETLLALATSPAFTLLRAVEQRSAGLHPVVVDRHPLMEPRSPALPPVATHAALGAGVLGAASLIVCSVVLLRFTRRRQRSFEPSLRRRRP